MPYANPNNYVKVSGRIAAKLALSEPHGAIWANQFDNVANRRAHVETTGPEIWDDTGGAVDGFVSAVGTGGTLAGVAEALRRRKPDRSRLRWPIRWVRRCTATTPKASSRRRATPSPRASARAASLPILRASSPTVSFQIPDEEAIRLVFEVLATGGAVSRRLVRHQPRRRGAAGASSRPGHTIVTVLADSGTRYQSKLFNAEFLRSKGLPVPAWLERETTVDACLE